MLDPESILFTEVANKLRAKYKGIRVYNEETDSPAGFPIYHFDFYRIKRLSEVYDMGYEDYFYGRGLCFIEWPELVEDLLPEETVKVTIEELDDGSRAVRC